MQWVIRASVNIDAREHFSQVITDAINRAHVFRMKIHENPYDAQFRPSGQGEDTLVIYENLKYTNTKGEINDSKKKDNTDEERETKD